MPADSNTENGVYYGTNDYGSLPRRCAAIAIDLIVLVMLWFLIAWIWSFFADLPGLDRMAKYTWLSIAFVSPSYFWCCLFASYIYMTVVKASRLRSVGYRVTDLKVVNLKGVRPSVFQMTWRFILLVFGPIDLIADLIWLGGDDNRQTIRDKIAATYVIRSHAAPMGAGVIVRRKYFLLGWSFIFQEVSRSRMENNA
ncbi:MAG TPA: RDD family protein [Thermodesulfobacteriota bacterium]|nr:RDD family protein [Thermodesulfobacteriota bacterium]